MADALKIIVAFAKHLIRNENLPTGLPNGALFFLIFVKIFDFGIKIKPRKMRWFLLTKLLFKVMLY